MSTESKPPVHSPTPDDEGAAASAPQVDESEKARRRKLKALIIGTLAAGGAFQLNGWQAQANGNRSSARMMNLDGFNLNDAKVKPLPGSLVSPLSPAVNPTLVTPVMPLMIQSPAAPVLNPGVLSNPGVGGTGPTK